MTDKKATGEIRFYHVMRGSADQVLPPLLSKIHSGGHRILVKLGDDEKVAALDAALWVFDPSGFLPHGAEKDDHAAEQPVLLTTGDENTNNANILVLADGATAAAPEQYEICCTVFNGQDAAAVAEARAAWKDFQSRGFDTVYFQQNDSGGWEKKA